jgi:pilus assembly protein Flp/PilA
MLDSHPPPVVKLARADHEPGQAPILHPEEATITRFIARFRNDTSGATAIEYGLIAALIAVVIITALTAVGSSLNKEFTKLKIAILWGHTN